ncbi:MAG: type II toxin-antitoxin system RelE/ParE family toxin [Longimonas sp.]|uniref:type II toxin-antitoxin system RelE/ParE family toxin n=1 Tax=Longimonas sp. TaxID=2039626 RepID=UPI003976768C
MARVRLTEQAQNELDAIIEYYERVGASDFAEVFEEKVIEKIRPLEQPPRMGRIVPEISDEAIREVLYRNCRIVYVVGRDDEEVDVLTIFHSSQQFGALGSDDE